MYSMFGVIFSKARGVDDDINTVASGTLTGVLYKSTGKTIYKLYSLMYKYLLLRYDVVSGSDIMPCVKIDKPLVIFTFSDVI